MLGPAAFSLLVQHKYTMRLLELFDSPYEFEVINHRDDSWVATVVLPDRTDLRFEAAIIPDDEDEDWREVWDVTFTRNGSTDITSEGDAARIMATVLVMMKKFVEAKDPLEFEFRSFESSRSRLYTAMLNRFAKELADYELEKFGERDDERKWVFQKKY